ncbi:MAG: hypothetical protein PS018_27840 [bacterium]|nr:hypothetical protein [bacterium]
MACVHHARERTAFADHMESVGKRALDESGKHPVNENDEEISRVNTGTRLRVIASEAKQSISRHSGWMDCFVACAPRNDGRAKTQMPGTRPGHHVIHYIGIAYA